MSLPEFFKNYLKIQKVSPITIKNYLADVNHFLEWLAQKTGIRYQIAGKAIFGLFTQETIEEYKTDQIANTPRSTINRRLSALRKFGQFGKSQEWISENPANKVANAQFTSEESKPTSEVLLEKFQRHLTQDGISPITIKNYLSDLRHFLGWLKAT